MAIYFDDLFDYIGHLGFFQWMNIVLTGLPPMVPGYENFAPNFFAGRQEYWCKVKGLNNFTHDHQKYIAIPRQNGKYSMCKQFDVDFNKFSYEELLRWNRSVYEGNLTTTVCTQYEFDTLVFTSTIQSQVRSLQ